MHPSASAGFPHKILIGKQAEIYECIFYVLQMSVFCNCEGTNSYRDFKKGFCGKPTG